MELRQLRYFIKAKELLNFTEAARQLHISQSTLSQQIAQLEDELGALLFDRIGKRIALTEAGQLFAGYALQSIHKAESGLQVLRDLNNMHTGEIRIGLTYGLRPILAPALIRFMQTWPGIKIQVVLGTSAELLEKLSHLDLDFILTFHEAEKEKQFRYQMLFESPMTIVMAPDMPLAKKKSVSLEDAARLPLALPSQGYSTRAFISHVLSQKNLSPNITLEINDINMLLEVIRSGSWYSILVRTSVKQEDGVVAVPITGKGMQRKAMIISLNESYEKKSVTAFHKLLKEMSKSMG
ncbi:LysR substrate-binding domain-containing protein [Chitinophaga pollutisoli]|uniref:LysR substrate-binding domain-containing protein n=1 Tax=Chitinophaga pollutisoli TaxID=3133966 RepID=A0ABZ2YSP5_9BACT